MHAMSDYRMVPHVGRWIFLWVFLALMTGPLRAQEPHPVFQERSYTFSGQIKTVEGDLLPGASIIVQETKKGTVADQNAFFSLTLPMGIYHFEISFVGYKTKVIPVSLRLNLNQVIRLEESLEILDEVTVTEGGVGRNIQTADQGITRLNVDRIRQLPRLLGESDVLRSVQTMAGVSSVGEGAGGFNVRGGNVDQNLILLDDITLFNASHLIGLYSAINPDMLRDITLYRSGMPARFGGRASAVLDARLREPSRDSFQLKGSVGLIASRFLAEGPILKDKWFVGLGGRISYADYFFRSVLRPEFRDTEAGFSELTLKSVYKINATDQLSGTFYTSGDAFRLSGDSLSTLEVNATSTRFSWKNTGASLRYNAFFTEQWGFSLLGSMSRYKPGFDMPGALNAAEFRSGVVQGQVQTEIKHFSHQHTAAAGVSLTDYHIQPGDFQPIGNSSFSPVHLPSEKGREGAVYVSDDWNLSPRIRVSAGMRYSVFALRGPTRVYDYSDPLYRDISTLIDTTEYAVGKVVNWYGGLEPRFSVRINVGEDASIKAGYQKVYQYLHLVSNTTSALPTDRWKLSDPFLKPQIANQFSAGWFQNFKANQWEASLELFYKTTENVPDYRSGVSLLLLDAPETAIIQGLGRAYGAELSIQKKGIRVEGFLNYTFSRSEIRIESPYPEDRVISGVFYPANYNRPHLLNMNAQYHLNKRLTLSATFTYQSGRASTLPEDRYEIAGFFLPNFTSRNDTKTADYHRLDLGLMVDPDPRKNRPYKDRWVFSVYNAYARKNPYSVFVETINDRPLSTASRARIYQLSIIGSIVPSISYEFEF